MIHDEKTLKWMIWGYLHLWKDSHVQYPPYHLDCGMASVESTAEVLKPPWIT